MEVIAFITQRHAEGGTSQPNPHIIAFEVPDSIHRTYFLFSQSINQSINQSQEYSAAAAAAATEK